MKKKLGFARSKKCENLKFIKFQILRAKNNKDFETWRSTMVKRICYARNNVSTTVSYSARQSFVPSSIYLVS